MTIIIGYILNIIGAIIYYKIAKKAEIPNRMMWFLIIVTSIIPYGTILYIGSIILISLLFRFLNWLTKK